MLEIRLARLRFGCRHSDCANVLEYRDSYLDMTTVVTGYSPLCVGILYTQWLVMYFAIHLKSVIDCMLDRREVEASSWKFATIISKVMNSLYGDGGY